MNGSLDKAQPGSGNLAKLRGKVAVVTGGGRGIGRAIAGRFVAEGAGVVITGLEAAELDEVSVMLGNGVRSVVGSVRDDHAAERALDTARKHFGPVDILVNNAGRSTQHGALIDADLDDLDAIWDTNLRAPLVWSQAAWRDGMRDRGGVILNIASVTGIDPVVGVGAYSISKAGLIHLTRILAAELGPNVRVNALAPAAVRTSSRPGSLSRKLRWRCGIRSSGWASLRTWSNPPCFWSPRLG